MPKEIPVLVERKALCCGCSACFAACPRDAITMEEDAEGLEYPVIDGEKCIRCGLCLRICPVRRKAQA